MSMTEMAALFAKAAHLAVDQRRKSGAPYHLHPFRVADLVRDAGGTQEMIAAAYLHDVVEDTAVTHDTIASEFGLVVSGYVVELTDAFSDPEHGNRGTRKAMERDRLARICPNAQTVKYADLIDNTREIVECDLDFASIYLDEKRELLGVMQAGDQTMWRKAWSMLVESEVTVRELKQERRPHTHRVYINGRRRATVYSEEAAWDVIGQYPLGALYEVRDADDNIRPEFVPY